MALHRHLKLPKATRPGDALLPDIGLAKLTVGTGAEKTTLAALASRNDFPHNHNDIGSLILYKYGKCLLTDPVAPSGRSVTIGRGKAKLKLEAVDTPGRFKVEAQGGGSLSWHSKTPVQRISDA